MTASLVSGAVFPHLPMKLPVSICEMTKKYHPSLDKSIPYFSQMLESNSNCYVAACYLLIFELTVFCLLEKQLSPIYLWTKQKVVIHQRILLIKKSWLQITNWRKKIFTFSLFPPHLSLCVDSNSFVYLIMLVVKLGIEFRDWIFDGKVNFIIYLAKEKKKRGGFLRLFGLFYYLVFPYYN